MIKLIELTREKMQEVIKIILDDLATIRTGRANPALIENIEIKVYEGTQKLKLMELATITVLDVNTLIIQPFDQSIIREIEKGLMQANFGFTPVVDNQIIRIKLPPLTSERREEFVKLAKQKIEGGRVILRQVRHTVMIKVKRMFENKEINEDDRFYLEKEIQKLTDEFNSKIDDILKHKVAELEKL